VSEPRPSFLNRLGARLDEVLAAVAPRWALDRAQARAAAEALAGTFNRGARYSRTDGRTTTGRGASADWINERAYDRREACDRARQLERDSVLVRSLLDRSSEAVVGPTGYRPRPATSDKGWNKAAIDLWNGWAGTTACDARGIATFPELLLLAFRSAERDGDVGAVKLPGKDVLGGNLRMFEGDELADPRGFAPNRVDGVDLDSQGRPIGYWLSQSPLSQAPDRRAWTDHVRVPAEFVIFMAIRQRLGQTRGMSTCAPISWLVDQFDGNVESVTVAARMAACFGLILKKKTRATNLPTHTGVDGIDRKKWRAEPGAVLELDLDEDAKQLDPKQPTQDFAQFLRMLGRIIALAFGLPLEVAFLDFSQTTYASSRGALLQAWNTWRCRQGTVKKFSSSVYTWKIIEWTEAGLLTPRKDALAHSWLVPGWQWLDPEAEIRAAMAAIDAGLDTYSNIAMRGGYDLEELIEQRKREREAFEAADLPEIRSTLTRDPTAPQGEEPERDKDRGKAARG
jgi:lambda family phage portal protein